MAKQDKEIIIPPLPHPSIKDKAVNAKVKASPASKAVKPKGAVKK